MRKVKPILAVKFFQTTTGKEPVREFLQELPKEDRKVIGMDIKEVQFGWPLGMPLVRKMATDLWEVRSTLEGRITRTLFTVLAGEMILLHAFIKKSQKTPKVDLDIAIKRLGQVKGGSHD